MRRASLFQAVSAIIMISGLLAAVILCSRLIGREKDELQRNAAGEVRQIAATLQSGVLSSIDSVDRLGRWWLSQGQPLDVEDWKSDGQLFLSHSPGIRMAAWIGADGYQYWEAAPGSRPFTLRTRPAEPVQKLIQAAQTRRALAVSDIFQTSGGGASFYVVFPIPGANRIRGYAVGLYDATILVSAVAKHAVRPDQRISVTSSGYRIYSSGALGREFVSTALTLGDKRWGVDLGVPMNYFLEFRGLAFTVVLVIGALVYSLGTLLYFSIRHSTQLQRSNRDIQDLNRELNRKISEFQRLLDVLPVGIAISYDPDCREVRINPALGKMLGISARVIVVDESPDTPAQPWRVLREGRELRAHELPMQVTAITGREVVAEEECIERADGTSVDVLAFSTPLFEENGMVRGVLSVFVDMSERKAQEQLRRDLERRLLRAQRMKSLGAMAAGIAHGFNNLLTSIIGEASLAAGYLPSEHEAARHIAASLNSAQQAARLIHQVLAFTGQSYRSLRPTDLSAIVRQSQTQLSELAGGKNHIQVEIAPQLPQVMADPDEIRQMLHNLVLNAVEALAPTNGAIYIRVDTYEATGEDADPTPLGENFVPGKYVRIEVRDTGSGMPAEIAERAFDPFFSTKFLGRGLGLSEVLGIMRAHKGSVRLRTGPDTGTSVSLFFPVGQRRGARDKRPQAA
jgi:PAS domain S-box-containing protein